MKFRGCTSILTFAICMTAVASAAAGVLVVDGAGGAGSQYTTVQDAINAAVDGDIVLVRTGTYIAPILNTNRDLTIVGDGTVQFGVMTSVGGTGVSNLGVGRSLVFRNITFYGSFLSPIGSHAVSLSGVQGAVWFDHCKMVGSAADGAHVVSSANVVFTNCELTGGGGFFDPQGLFASHPPSAGLNASDSTVFVYQSTCKGGKGVSGFLSPGFLGVPSTPGAPAIQISGGALLLANSILNGGPGGNGYTWDSGGGTILCAPPLEGGPGLKLTTNGPIARIAASTILAGAAGNAVGSCSAPPPTSPISIATGSVINLFPTPGKFEIPSPVREGQSFSIEVTDVPGNSVLLLGSIARGQTLLPQYGAALHVGVPFQLFAFGNVPANGHLVSTSVMPNLPPSLFGFRYFLQSATCDGQGVCSLTAPAALVILDGSL